ncbi:MAG: zinc finger domain-containing protein, partial [bacterium]
LKEIEIKKIFQASKNILKQAIKYRGTTFRNFADHRGHRGNFIDHLQVYGRTGQKCTRCKNGMINKIKIAGRGTHYCYKCQK